MDQYKPLTFYQLKYQEEQNNRFTRWHGLWISETRKMSAICVCLKLTFELNIVQAILKWNCNSRVFWTANYMLFVLF